MAQSRLEKIGTIYTRTSGLIKSGALKWEDRPLWYDVYEAFPPQEEPRVDRPVPNIKLKKIFYEEDKIRALFHQNNKKIGATNMFDKKYKTLTQKFIEAYRTVERQYDCSTNERQIYEEAINILKRQSQSETQEDVSLSSTFREAEKKEKSNIKIKVSDLFKD